MKINEVRRKKRGKYLCWYQMVVGTWKIWWRQLLRVKVPGPQMSRMKKRGMITNLRWRGRIRREKIRRGGGRIRRGKRRGGGGGGGRRRRRRRRRRKWWWSLMNHDEDGGRRRRRMMFLPLTSCDENARRLESQNLGRTLMKKKRWWLNNEFVWFLSLKSKDSRRRVSLFLASADCESRDLREFN